VLLQLQESEKKLTAKPVSNTSSLQKDEVVMLRQQLDSMTALWEQAREAKEAELKALQALQKVQQPQRPQESVGVFIRQIEQLQQELKALESRVT
jgi:acetyl-CoA carboxylase alpha subunit